MALVIKSANLWNGTGTPVQENMGIVMENGKFTRIAPCPEVIPNEGDTVIDVAGKFVMPGMIDCHVHVCSSGEPNEAVTMRDATDGYKVLIGAQMIRQDLEAGFTTVRNMGTEHYLDMDLKKAWSEGRITGSRIITSGPFITMTGGHGWTMGLESDGEDECRKHTRQVLRQGVEVVKIMATGGVMTPGVEPGSPQLTEPEIRAAVEEAHKAGRKTATHAQGTEGIKNAVRAGIDSIEHGIFLDDELLEMMKSRGTALVPTLVAPWHINDGGVAAGIPVYAVEKSMRIAPSHVKSFRMAVEAGLKIALGTDSGTPLNFHGCNAFELQLMIENGMSNEQALLAATKVASEVVDRANLIGSIEVGKLADLLIVDGNPLQDIQALVEKSHIKTVIQNGKVVHSR